MKKINGLAIFTLLAVSLLLAGCKNFFTTPVSAPSLPDGKGSVTISFQAGRSALMPSLLDFDIYAFTFTETGSGNDEFFQKTKGEDFTFILDLGVEYTLDVKAYKTSMAPGNLAACGSSEEPFTVSAATFVKVGLSGSADATGPFGTFSYNISFPEGVNIDNLVLKYGKENIDLKAAALDAGKNITAGISHSVDIHAGYYLLLAEMSMNGFEAEDSISVLILSNTTTFYEYAFTKKDFAGDNYLFDWYGFNIEGLSHYFNNDTADETKHFIPSRITGVQFGTFTDANGVAWNNVLKLEQSDNGASASSTVTMTYAVQEAGSYTLSMWFWLENSMEPATFSWYNTGGKRANDELIFSNPLRAWRPLGSDSAQQRGKWIPWQGTINLLEDEELCLIVRGGSDGELGIKSAAVYIRDLALEYNGITIIETNNGVKVSPDSVLMVQGKTRQLTANKPVHWSSDKPGVATVNVNGLVSSVGLGTAVITAELIGDPAVFAKVTVKVVEEGSQYIALTFDDAGSYNFQDTLSVTDDLLNLLEEKDVKATFFIPGHYENHTRFTRQDMDLRIKRMWDNGHEIGNHAYNHLYNYEFWQLYGEIEDTDALIANAIGIPGFRTTHFRPPNGDPSGNNAVNVAALLGKTVIIWDSDSVDYAAPGDTSFLYPSDERSPPMTFAEKVDDIYDRITLGRARQPGEAGGTGDSGRIVLLHAIYPHTVPAVSRAIDKLREEGFVFVNVTELLQRRGDYVGPGEVISPHGEKTHGFPQWHQNFKFVDPSERYLSLEFNEPLDGAIIDALDAMNIKATFFVAGAEAEGNEDLLRRVYGGGHEIGNLSWTRGKKYPADGNLLKQEIKAADVKLGAILNVSNFKTKFFMPPDGLLQANYERIAAAANGKPIVLWDEDYPGASLSRAGIAEHIASTNQNVFLISDLENLDEDWLCGIAILKARSYQFLTLTEFMNRKGITLIPGDVYNMELDPLPPPENEGQGIILEWAKTGFSLVASENSCTVRYGESITIIAPAGFYYYDWFVGITQDAAQTGNEFTFDSTGKSPGVTYKISLIAGSAAGIPSCDTIAITVTE